MVDGRHHLRGTRPQHPGYDGENSVICVGSFTAAAADVALRKSAYPIAGAVYPAHEEKRKKTENDPIWNVNGC